ncbi:MAG: hypothetical protein JWM76_3050 [Pseudonocardiales bacterium]|nr:hypothetical protein [Pseudonocardiales bacterium]
MNVQSVVGKVGRVATRVRGGELPGEVRVVLAGIPHYYLGFSSTPLAEGTPVLVINDRGARQIDVEPWEHSNLDVDDAQFYNERK